MKFVGPLLGVDVCVVSRLLNSVGKKGVLFSRLPGSLGE